MSITTHVQELTAALHAIDNRLTGMLAGPAAVTPAEYTALEPDLIALEKAINHHATIAAQAAALAERTNAAHTIGSTHLIDYLTTTFGLSKARAHHRITLAHSLYPKPTTPSPGSNGDKSNGGPDGSSNDDDSGDDDPDPEPEAEPGQEPASGAEPGTSGGAGTPEPTHCV